MVNTIYLFSFMQTPRKFIIAELSIRKLGSSSVLIIRLFEFTRPSFYTTLYTTLYTFHDTLSKKGRVNSNSRIISTDEDPSLRIKSSAIINLRGVSTKLNKYNIAFVNSEP